MTYFRQSAIRTCSGKLAEKNIDAKWYLMCPHEIQTVKDYALEDFWGRNGRGDIGNVSKIPALKSGCSR